MTTNALLLAALLVSPAADPEAPPATQPTVERSAGEVPPDLQGEVLSVDVEGKKLTLRTHADGESRAELELNVEGEAVAALADLRPGDTVVASCRDGAAEECVVTMIKKSGSRE